MLLANVFGTAAALMLCVSHAMAQTPREVAEKVMPSVVLLIMEDAQGQPSALGSGFVVGEGIVATNHHVIKGAARGYAKLMGQGEKLDVKSVVGVDERADLALLLVESLRAPALAIGDSSAMKVGDEVFVVGNPQGLEGTFSNGIVSAIRQAEAEHLIQITAPISPGSSGGPVLNRNGEVIGIAIGMLKDGQNLNFAIPASYLIELLAKKAEARPFVEDKRIYRPLDRKDQFDELPFANAEPEPPMEDLWRAANDGDPDAMFKLGEAYWEGHGILENRFEAVRWYHKAAEIGHTLAMHHLGCMYQRGSGVQKDCAEAAKWLHKAAEKNCSPAIARLASLYEDAGDEASAAYWWRRAAEHPDADAYDMRKLGAILARIRGIPGNAEEADKWLRISADRYRKKAQNGDIDAMLVLAEMYAVGEGVPQNEQEAANWVAEVAKKGELNSVFFNGICYELGLFDPQDYAKAARWYRWAAEYESGAAMLRLGNMYSKGRGTAQDDVEAAKWFRKAADHGTVEAMFELGVIYKVGRGLPQDDREAVRWFRRAAEQGDAAAMRNLGLMYALGHGVPRDDAEAYVWYSVAAAFGINEAHQLRNRIEQLLTPDVRLEAQKRSQELFELISDRAKE